jgi:hypothetical protein
MKLRHLILGFNLLFLFCLTAQAERLIFPLLTPESQSNIIVLANFDHPKPCPPEYTNLISNTNLFSPAEQKKLKEVALKYNNISTNCGPAGSVFKGWGLRQEKVETWTNTFKVACFAYTNSDAQEEIRAYAGNGHLVARFRTQAGDGYDVVFANNALISYQSYNNFLLDGLYVGLELSTPNNPKYDEHCRMWARFSKGKILGEFLSWGPDNKIIDEVEFKEPFDFLKYGSTKLDLAWTEVKTNTTNSAQK